MAVTTHFGATHTRFSHTVGTVLAANAMLRHLTNGRGTEGSSRLVRKALEALQDGVIRKACLAFCALHDAFHGPFGHSLDIMKDVFGATSSEKLDNKYLSDGLEAAIRSQGNDPVARQLRAAAELWVGEREAGRLLGLVLLLSTKTKLLRERPELYFLRQIADSEVDADRFDYVIRDGLYLEHKDYHGDHAQALATVRVVEWSPEPPKGKQTLREEPKPRACLAFASNAENEIADLLGRRGEYYARYYETAEKLVVDDMICHGLAYVLGCKGIEDRTADREEAQTVAELKRNIMMLTDESFIPALLELKAAPECYELLFRYQQRRFFNVVKTIDVRLDQVQRIRFAARRWVDGVEDFLQETANARGVTWAATLETPDDQEIAKRAFSAQFDSSIQGTLAVVRKELEEQELEKRALEQKLDAVKKELEEKTLGWGFQYWTHAVFRHRQAFERAVWARLTTGQGREHQLAKLAEREYGNADQRWRFDRFPPVHVTSPSHFAMFDYRDIQLKRKESPYPVEEILFYDIEHPERVGEVPIKPAAKEDLPSYPLVLSAPREIVEILTAPRLIEVFLRELRELDWLVQRYSEP